jgi:hypothetical protein
LVPRHEKFPSFRDAAISVPGADESRLQVSLISASRRTEIHAQPAKRPKGAEGVTMGAESTVLGSDPRTDSARNRSHPSPGQIMSFEAQEETSEPPTMPDPAFTSPINPVTLPAGTACRILLLRSVSASKSRPGDLVQARLLEPVVLNSHLVLPAGSVFEGSVIKATPPRMLSRAGSLSLTFTGLTLSNGSRLPLSASLTGVELTRGSHTKMDAEGRFHGDRPGVAWMLINGGVTAGIAKEVDDGTQLVMEAILSGATDASTAGTARIAGTVVSGIFMLTRRGRDVILPDLTEMSLVLNRPLQISAQTPLAPANGTR